jgi:hypothetical protein
MGELSPIHWLIFLVLMILFGVPWFTYRHGKKVGDQAGYIRGYKEGQQGINAPKVINSGTFSEN